MKRLSISAVRLAWVATALLAVMAASSSRLRAQDTIRPAPVKEVARTPANAGNSAAAPRSLPQRIFDTPWVIFPTRLAVVIVLSGVSALALTSGCWGAVRFAHLLRHLQWQEAPRRLKRGEIGAAGASIGFEFEERLTTNRAEDQERDRQIAALHASVKRLSLQQREIVSTIMNLFNPGERGRHG